MPDDDPPLSLSACGKPARIGAGERRRRRAHRPAPDWTQGALPAATGAAPATSDHMLWFHQRSFDVALLSGHFLVRASPSLSALLGYREGELEHLPLNAVVDPTSLTLLTDAVGVISRKERLSANVGVIWTPSGAVPLPCLVELHEIEVAGSPRILALSRPRHVEGGSTDLALHTAFLSVNEPIVIFDKDGQIIDFNEASAVFFRFFERAAMRTALPVFHDLLELQSLTGEVLQRSEWPSARALRGETGRSAECRLLRKDSGEIWLCSFNFSPIRDASGAIAGAAVTARDTTEVSLAVDALSRFKGNLETVIEERSKAILQAKSDADRANAAKTRFLATASHDLRQPLQSASAYLSALDTLLDDPAAQEIAGGLRNSLEVMAELLNTLLDISRLQSGAIEPKIEMFPIADVLRRAMLDHAPAAEAKHLELRMHLTPCTVRTDRALLMRIVENLLSNAIHYTETGHITIGNRLNGDQVILEISDSGIGIPPESLELIFEEYYQVENKSRDRSRGMGLGLSIVRHLTRLLDHDLTVSSTVGKGTSFSLCIPVGTRLPPRRSATVCAGAEMVHKPVVLVVDDERSIRHSLTMLLSAHGMIVHTADDAAHAMRMLADGLAPDLLLTDYRLPGVTGNELVKHIRDNGHADVACIIMTGDTTSSDALQKEVAGCAVMKKPIDCIRLPAIIREAIAARRT